MEKNKKRATQGSLESHLDNVSGGTKEIFQFGYDGMPTPDTMKRMDDLLAAGKAKKTIGANGETIFDFNS